MLDSDYMDKLHNTIKLLDKHFERLDFAYSQIKHLLPLDIEKFNKLKDVQISYFDQFIFRFAKIQDNMGEKLFPQILIALDENIESLAFIDRLNKLEKLGIISNSADWLFLRKLRNEVSHEYPIIDDDSVVALNSLLDAGSKLKEIYFSCIGYLKKRNFI